MRFESVIAEVSLARPKITSSFCPPQSHPRTTSCVTCDFFFEVWIMRGRWMTSWMVGVVFNIFHLVTGVVPNVCDHVIHVVPFGNAEAVIIHHNLEILFSLNRSTSTMVMVLRHLPASVVVEIYSGETEVFSRWPRWYAPLDKKDFPNNWCLSRSLLRSHQLVQRSSHQSLYWSCCGKVLALAWTDGLIEGRLGECFTPIHRVG